MTDRDLEFLKFFTQRLRRIIDGCGNTRITPHLDAAYDNLRTVLAEELVGRALAE